MKRYMGVDLHRRVFTCCVRLESGRQGVSEWRLEQLPQFVKKLRATDEVAVEVTGNTRLFYNAVASHVARVVVVDPHQFRVISQSVKKTDPNDARNLALYLAKGLLPEMRMKDKEHAQVASLTQTRDRAGEAAHGAEEQGEQPAFGARDRAQDRRAFQRKRSGAGACRRSGGTDPVRVADYCGSDSQPEPQHRGTGEGHRAGRQELERSRKPDQHQGHRPAGRQHSTEGWPLTSGLYPACTTPTRRSARDESPNAAASSAARPWCSAR
jgi:hypothetical protein